MIDMRLQQRESYQAPSAKKRDLLSDIYQCSGEFSIQKIVICRPRSQIKISYNDGILPRSIQSVRLGVMDETL